MRRLTVFMSVNRACALKAINLVGEIEFGTICHEAALRVDHGDFALGGDQFPIGFEAYAFAEYLQR